MDETKKARAGIDSANPLASVPIEITISVGRARPLKCSLETFFKADGVLQQWLQAIVPCRSENRIHDEVSQKKSETDDQHVRG